MRERVGKRSVSECVCVCVWERETERKREREKERKSGRECRRQREKAEDGNTERTRTRTQPHLSSRVLTLSSQRSLQLDGCGPIDGQLSRSHRVASQADGANFIQGQTTAGDFLPGSCSSNLIDTKRAVEF